MYRKLPNSRTWMFLYTTGVLLILIGLGSSFIAFDHGGTLFSGYDQLRYGFIAAWFGMLGGVAISYKGIIDHRVASQWDSGWILWYIVRPFNGFIVGVLTLALLAVVNTAALPSIPALAVACFTLGTQERRFFAFLYEVAKLVLNTPNDTGGGSLQINKLTPTAGGASTLLIIEGAGFQKGATVSIGGTEVATATVSSDGTSIAVVTPGGLTAGDLAVLVTNPDNTALRAATKFKYS